VEDTLLFAKADIALARILEEFLPPFLLVEQRGADGEVRQVKRKKEKVQREYLGPWAGWEGENLALARILEEFLPPFLLVEQRTAHRLLLLVLLLGRDCWRPP
jgi:uncharacterized protein YecA (UPF0149 family)